MAAQPAEIEQGRGASMLEGIFDVRRNGVFSRAAGPCRKRTVVMLRDPRLPAVIVRGDPQPDRLCVRVVGHVKVWRLHAGSDLLAVAEVEETVRSAEVDLHVIRPALFVRVDPFAVKQHRLTATDAVQRNRPLVSPQREFHHL